MIEGNAADPVSRRMVENYYARAAVKPLTRYQQYRLYGHGRVVALAFSHPVLWCLLLCGIATVPGFILGWMLYGVFHES